MSYKVRNKITVPNLPTLIQRSVGIPSQSNKAGKRDLKKYE
jgi:hypothetical protein